MERFGFLGMGWCRLRKLTFSNKRMVPYLMYQCLRTNFLLFTGIRDFHKETSDELLKYIFKFNLQSSIPEAVKLLKMNGVLSIASASVER